MKETCNYCGGGAFEQRKIEYLYTHGGRRLLVLDTPVEVCLQCGMIYYDAAVLKEIERCFFAIHERGQKPDRYVRLPEMTFEPLPGC